MRPMKALSKKWLSWWSDKWFKKPEKSTTPATYFVHIPKTAGTSFIVLLDRFFAVDKIFPHQLWRETKAIDVNANAEYELFRGHFGGGGVAVLSPKEIQYFTILRDPKTLARSTYQYVQREQNTKVHELVKDEQMSFSEFLTHPMTSPLIKNRLIRNISFDFKEDPAAQEVFLSAETIKYLQAIIQQQKPAIDDDQRLLRAKEFLTSCRWFGLLERFDESIQLLSYVMCWPPMGASQKLNTHNSGLTMSSEETELLEQVNQQDIAFYAFAGQIFEQKLTAMMQALATLRDNEQQSIDDLLDINYQQQHVKSMSGQLPDALTYGFDQVLLGSQWHRREVMQPENEYFRWTGPGQSASIDFWLQAVNYVITIRLINATSVELLDDLKLSLNGQSVKWQSSDTGLVRILRLNCGQDQVQPNGLLRLGIHCNNMISHQQAFGSNDERLVGVAVHWIKFNHVK